MTRIRTQLRSTRIAYRTARYPGDLSAELLPRPSAFARALAGRRFLLAGGVGATAAAAALILSLLLSRASTVPQPWSNPQVERAGLADWFPIAPDKMPLPHFQPPSLPLRAPELRLDLPAGVERYQDMAMQYRGQYRGIQVPDSLRHTTVPTIPTDLPTRGVEWFQKVWTGEKSA
jgi:hypothetical protein